MGGIKWKFVLLYFQRRSLRELVNVAPRPLIIFKQTGGGLWTGVSFASIMSPSAIAFLSADLFQKSVVPIPESREIRFHYWNTTQTLFPHPQRRLTMSDESTDTRSGLPSPNQSPIVSGHTIQFLPFTPHHRFLHCTETSRIQAITQGRYDRTTTPSSFNRQWVNKTTWTPFSSHPLRTE